MCVKRSFSIAVVTALAMGACKGDTGPTAGPTGFTEATGLTGPTGPTPPGRSGIVGFTLTTSSPATYSNPSGAFEPMPSTSLTFPIQSPGLLTISFSARGAVAPSGSQSIPIVFIQCQIDGQACQPDGNPVEFLYPQFCCDTRSFNWVAQDVSAGSHTVEILWGMGNPTSAIVTNRSLLVEVITP